MRDALEKPPSAAGSQTRLSADGSWWWDGARWQAALSPDGFWRWDGERWTPAADIDPEDPAAVLELFDRTADQRFAAAGRLLALRRSEWQAPNPEVADLVERAAPLAERLAAFEAQETASAGTSLPAIIGRLAGEVRSGERERVAAELHPMASLLGRMAPQPSLPEADDLIASARALEERAVELQKALAVLEEREAEHRKGVEEAMQEVADAKTGREAALAGIEAQVRAAELEREQAVEDIARALRGLRMPGPGTEQARLQNAVLYENWVETADGRGPVDGAEVHLGTAPQLWKAHRQALAELLRLESAAAGRFHDSLAAGGDEGYALVMTRHVRSIVPFPPGAEKDAQAFAKKIGEAADGSSAPRRQWEEQVRAAEEALEVAIGDSSRVERARADLEKAVADADLEAPVRAAERQLKAAERPPAGLDSARARVREAVEGLLKPPPPLRPAGGRNDAA